jgi:hypothetical protein
MVAHPLLQRAPLLLVVALARPRAAQAVGHEPGDQHRSDPAGGDPGKQKTQRPGHARHPFWARGRASRPAVAGTAGLCREAAARHGTSIRPPRACLARFAAGRIHLHQRSPASGSGPAPASSDQAAPEAGVVERGHPTPSSARADRVLVPSNMGTAEVRPRPCLANPIRDRIGPGTTRACLQSLLWLNMLSYGSKFYTTSS